MQEANHRSTKKPGRKRRSSRRRRRVLLISTNPLALPELVRLAKPSRMRCLPHYLKLGQLGDCEEIRVPPAAILVVDSFSTGPWTEKVVAAIRTQHPRACVMVVVNGMADTQGFALLQLGVKGIVNQRDMTAALGKAIASVAGGGVRMPRGLMAKFLDSTFSAPPVVSNTRLSQRERQVHDAVVKSHSNKEIADELNISESTVKFHLARIFRKFGVRRRAELIVQSTQDPASIVH